MPKSIWFCPNPKCNGATLKKVLRRKRDEETGERKYAGEFYGCPNWKDNGCDYAVGLESGKPSGKVYRVYVLGEDESLLDAA